MKRIAWIVGLAILLAGCAPAYDKQEEELMKETQENNQKEKAIVPKYSISDEYYRPLVNKKDKYEPSKARGIIVRQVDNRLDIEEMEMGLRRHSKEVYDPEEYFFQDGQYLSDDILNDWLDRKVNEEGSDGTPNGLNPSLPLGASEQQYRENPVYLSHILEQNFFKKTDEDNVELSGISISLAMKSEYEFQVEKWGASYYEEISRDEMLTQGKKMAQTVLERLRGMNKLEDIPIMITIYQQEAKSSVVPGNFLAKTTVEGKNGEISEWETIDEKYVLFPSDEAEENYKKESEDMLDFQNDVANYFPNYIGVVGKGFYKDDELVNMEVTIPIEFKGKAEIVSLTQYVYSLIMENFPNYFGIEVKVESHEGQESLIVRKPGEDKPYVHIYDK
ncbi:hypothetical protein N780_17905 [Pontibacillus chungwhensis BH030062]|uniref:Calcium ABC transporter ATPase n=1 Tax=Pontibacillus chungwhensis BH030062 TaxID=1385513 RepID=A0A0A2UX60_9BACI|nr:CamS family sex pheromone protein [Pontibacillus chungwhensis]KGP91121.1 hypothetical protein N780_17905 [Pontibacillus chungwhensis BH030062]